MKLTGYVIFGMVGGMLLKVLLDALAGTSPSSLDVWATGILGAIYALAYGLDKKRYES